MENYCRHECDKNRGKDDVLKKEQTAKLELKEGDFVLVKFQGKNTKFPLCW